MARRGRRLTCVLGCMCLVVLVLTGYALKDLALEQLYIWRLSSGDRETRDAAAIKLAQMNSLRAVPQLLRIVQEDPGESADWLVRTAEPTEAGNTWWQKLSPTKVTETGKDGLFLFSPILYSLWDIGPQAKPFLEATLNGEANVHHQHGEWRSCLTGVIRAWESIRCEVRLRDSRRSLSPTSETFLPPGLCR
jgi:hypothetical protein